MEIKSFPYIASLFFITSLSGCGLINDRAPQTNAVEIKHANSLLNATVKPTSFQPRTDIARTLQNKYHTISYTAVLQRKNNLYIGVTYKDNQHAAMTTHQIISTVHAIVPNAKSVYVTTDETLVNHFHNFQSSYLQSKSSPNSDLIVSDIQRNFPNA